MKALQERTWDWKTAALAAISGCVLALGAGAARAQDLSKAVLLVASPTLQGLYSHALVAVVPVDGTHMGFILNRATDLALAELFPQHAPSAKVADPVYLGGREMAHSIFAVTRRDPGGEALELFDHLYVTASIKRIIEQTPNDARYFAGFVGWEPGELQNEIDEGDWYVTGPDSSLFFRPDTSGLWEELVKRLGNGHLPEQGHGLLRSKLESAPGLL